MGDYRYMVIKYTGSDDFYPTMRKYVQFTSRYSIYMGGCIVMNVQQVTIQKKVEHIFRADTYIEQTETRGIPIICEVLENGDYKDVITGYNYKQRRMFELEPTAIAKLDDVATLLKSLKQDDIVRYSKKMQVIMDAVCQDRYRLSMAKQAEANRESQLDAYIRDFSKKNKNKY